MSTKQIKNMQLYIDDEIFLRSYNTTIGVLVDNVWNITTTSSQITKFSKIIGINNIKKISQEELIALIISVNSNKKVKPC